MDKYRKKLPKDELKRFAKEIGKILTASDFKHKRVEDPTKITEYHEKKVKKSVRDYFEKAVAKRVEYEKKKAEKKAAEALKNGQTPASVVSNDIDTPATADTSTPLDADAEDKATMSDVDMSDDELHGQSVPATPIGESSGDDTLKRKRDEEAQHTPADTDDAFAKRFKADGTAVDASPGPPPPPPPPPADAQVPDQIQEEEDPAAAEMRVAQEALERENEAAVREEEMQQAMAMGGEGAECKMGGGNTVNGTTRGKSGDGAEGDSNGSEMEGLLQSERTEVLSH